MSTVEPTPGVYEHCGRHCVHCGDVGPFRRQARSTDPFRCVRCNQPERDTDAPVQATPVAAMVVEDVREIEAASGVREKPANGGASHVDELRRQFRENDEIAEDAAAQSEFTDALTDARAHLTRIRTAFTAATDQGGHPATDGAIDRTAWAVPAELWAELRRAVMEDKA